MGMVGGHRAAGVDPDVGDAVEENKGTAADMTARVTDA